MMHSQRTEIVLLSQWEQCRIIWAVNHGLEGLEGNQWEQCHIIWEDLVECHIINNNNKDYINSSNNNSIIHKIMSIQILIIAPGQEVQRMLLNCRMWTKIR